MMLSEELNQWGLPIKPTKKESKQIEPVMEDKVTCLEDVHLTLRYLSEMSEPEKIEVLSVEDEQESGEWLVRMKVNAGDLTSLVKAAHEVADKEGHDDIDMVLDELLNLQKIEKALDKDLWNEIRHQGSFTGSSVEFVDYPRKPEDFKDSKFEIEIKINFEKPRLDQSIEDLVSKVLKRNMEWWV
jgi:hypothetical protein